MKKENINSILVRQLVSSQFPQWAHLPIKPVQFGGWDNCTFHLGTEMTVRLPSAGRYAQQVKKEQRWLPILANQLPLPIPVHLAMGVPAHGYPWHWSIYRWIEGVIAVNAPISDRSEFAATLAEFLNALHRIDISGGPPPGKHNFYRGGSLSVYDKETRDAVAALNGRIDQNAVTTVWETALNANWQGSPSWVHGDVSPTNLLVKEGRLSAVIDFGCSAVGDPACDLAIAWTFFSGKSRAVFRSTLSADEGTWARARGWALWKALITLAEHNQTNSFEGEKSRKVITEVLSSQKN